MTADTIGGVWTYALELACALDRQGIDVAIATMGAPLNLGQIADARKLPNVEIFESKYKLEWMSEPWADVDAATDWLLDLEQRVVPDIVHLNGYCHAAASWTAPKLAVGHSDVVSWFKAVRGQNAPSGWNTYRTRVRHGLQAADCVAAPTSSMLRSLEENFGRLRNTRVVLNGREPSNFKSTTKEPIVFSAGRLWDEAKNVTALAKIAGDLPWRVYIAGDTSLPAEARINEINTGNLYSLGVLSSKHIAEWYSRAAIYALPARYEPFGLSILEAALSGCALVLGDIPSLREIWQHNAVFVPPDDENALRSAINELINDQRHRDEFSRRARNRALRFTPDQMADGYLRIYGELIEDRAVRMRLKTEDSICV
jgi:glycogen synthase